MINLSGATGRRRASTYGILLFGALLMGVSDSADRAARCVRLTPAAAAASLTVRIRAGGG
jgi:hypothetical protein